MAVEMQRRMEQLDKQWRQRGIEHPFRARVGINTGFCNVGNFGSEDRMDYTIIGAEANLAARLQAIAEPGGICLSYETYALVRDLVRAQPLAPIQMKGIRREVVPYAVEGLLGELAQRPHIISESTTGLDLFVDLEALDDEGAERAQRRFTEALSALAVRKKTGAVVASA
jgi:adenylate cyclase